MIVLVSAEGVPVLVKRGGRYLTTEAGRAPGEGPQYQTSAVGDFEVACAWVDDHTFDGSENFEISSIPG